MMHLGGRSIQSVAADADAAAIHASSVAYDGVAYKSKRAAEIIKIHAAPSLLRTVQSQQRRPNVNGSGVWSDEYTSSVTTGLVLQKATVAYVERAVLHCDPSAILSRQVVVKKAV